MTLDQGYGTSLGPVIGEILFKFMNSVKSYGSDNVKNHYGYSDQGYDTSLGLVWQFYEKLFQSMLSVKTYVPDKV
jgi:hypothetical protein